MDELIPLSDANLGRLSERARVPGYDRGELTAGIVHIGLGNFHRAHQAWYLHRLMDQGLSHDWAIVGAGVRPPDAAQRSRLVGQDCLTSLIELDPEGKSAEIIGSMIDYVPVEEGNATLIARMAEPDIRIVSLTVTEGGYYLDPASGGFEASHADIVHDAQHPTEPRTAFGAMIAALRLRRERGHGPFTGQSCDNLPGNGDILRRTITSLARLSDPSLADWIDQNCSFPNSMVDCIVPATGEKEIALARSFGIDDASPVTHENFRQWVTQDDFCAGRPQWEKVGVTFSSAVEEYEALKLRILNGGHQIISMPGELLGLGTIADVMANSLIRQLFRKVIADEVAPHIKPVPGLTPSQYFDLIESRFSNGEIADTTRRVAFDGSSRQPGFLIPSLRDCLEKGIPVDGLALSTAMWCKYCEGRREDGRTIEPNDPHWSTLNPVALAAESNPVRWLQQRQYYGDLSDNELFVDTFARWHRLLSDDGVESAISAYLSGETMSS